MTTYDSRQFRSHVQMWAWVQIQHLKLESLQFFCSSGPRSLDPYLSTFHPGHSDFWQHQYWQESFQIYEHLGSFDDCFETRRVLGPMPLVHRVAMNPSALIGQI